MSLDEEVGEALEEYSAGFSLDLEEDRARVYVFSDDELPIEELAADVRRRTPYWYSTGRHQGDNDYLIRLSDRSRL